MWKKALIVAICLLAGLLLTGAVFASGQGDGKGGKPVTLVVSIRGLDNPYHANYKNGADALGKKLGLAVDTLSTEANSEKGIADIKAEVAKTGGNMVLNLDPNQAPDVVPIAKILETAGVYWVNWWNKPDDVKVWDYPHWVAHISFDSIGTGYFNAKELFKTFKTPNQGKIVALQGMLANTPAVERFLGLQKALAEFPGVKLLQWEGCDWDRTKAYNATKAMLVAHPDVDGIWSANDEMAMGAIQALKEAGLAGKVMVNGTDGIPEIFDAIKAGLACSTVYQDSKYQAQLGLMMSKAAKEGKLDVAKLPRKYRSFKISGVEVNKANIDKVMKDYANLSPEYDFSDFFAKWAAEAP
jgi:ribose transport system substrate-binding protein